MAGGKSRFELSGYRLFEARLIVFDDEEVVTAAITNLLTQIALAEHRIARDDATFEHQTLE